MGDKKMTTKKHTATVLILMFVGWTGLVQAQMSTRFKAQVPFAFVANGKTMPAGECIVAFDVNGWTLLRSGEQQVFTVPLRMGRRMRAKRRHLCFTDMATSTS
jgi:hypothetical protein